MSKILNILIALSCLTTSWTEFVPIFDMRFDSLFQENCDYLKIPENCFKATACTKRSGYYEIKPQQFINDTILVECDTRTDSGGFIVIQRRHDGSVDFFRSWSEYQNGFGDIDGEFFIGLDKLYALTNFDGPQELFIVMERANSKTAYASYSSFAIGNEAEKYYLKRLGKYAGTAGDSLQKHVGCKFSTKDNDNDNWNEGNCAINHGGAWWYNTCHQSNLNGRYGVTENASGIHWFHFNGHEDSLKSVAMMIRRRRT